MRLLKGTELLEGICPAVSTDHMKLAMLLQSNAWRVCGFRMKTQSSGKQRLHVLDKHSCNCVKPWPVPGA